MVRRGFRLGDKATMLKQGHIVRAFVADQAGRDEKRRPVVIIGPYERSQDGEEQYLCVAITSTFDRRRFDDKSMVLLPWSHDKRARSGLDRECVAKCDWLIVIRHSQIESTLGYVGDERLIAILERLSLL